MGTVKKINSVDDGIFVIDEDLHIIIAQQVQVYFVTIITDGCNERGVPVKCLHSLVKWIFPQLSPRTHGRR